jgi:hypothetical protein
MAWQGCEVVVQFRACSEQQTFHADISLVAKGGRRLNPVHASEHNRYQTLW